MMVLAISSGLLVSCSLFNKNEEQNIYFLQLSGPFYTSNDPSGPAERTFLRERSRTVDEIIKSSEDAFKFLKRANKGFIKYEENLLDYIKKAEINESHVKSADMIISGIAANRALLKSYEEAIETFKKAKPSNNANKAILDYYIFTSVSEMFEIQDIYREWLENTTAAVSYIVSGESDRKSNKVISSSASIHRKKIHDNLVSAKASIVKADTLFSALASVDYHSSFLYLTEAEQTLVEIKAGSTKSTVSQETISELETAIRDLRESTYEFPGLLPLHENKDGSLFLSTIKAAEEDLIPDFGLLSDSLEFYRAASDSNPQNEFSEDEYIDDIKSISAKVTNASDLGDIVAETGAVTKPPGEITTSATREDNIGRISDGQMVVSGISFLSSDRAYSIAIDKIAELIANGKNISPEAKENAINRVRNELNDIIGGNKDDFLDVLLNQSAEEIYGTFEVWRDDIVDLSTHDFTRDDIETFLLLLGYGIEIEEITATEETISPSASPSSTATPSPTPSSIAPGNTPSVNPNPSASQEPAEDVETYDVFNIAATYNTMMNISNNLSNGNILSIIYNWSDPVDYSSLEREDKPDGDGGIRGWKYTDNESISLGWEVTQYGDSVEYIYHFPKEMDSTMKIIRKGTLESSYFYQIETEDETSGRRTAVRLNENPEFEGDSITYIYEEENDIKDGLNTTRFNSLPTFEIYDTGEENESYTFDEGVLVREVITHHEGSSIVEHTKLYYKNGKLKQEKHEKDGKEFGLYTSYKDDGTLVTSIEYTDGRYDGKHQLFFDDGHLRTFTVYSNGKKNGTYEKYYSDAAHPIEVRGQYANDEMTGKWETFMVDGTPKSVVNYKDGMKDGEYKSFATGNTSASSIHAFGQYSMDKRTGEWLYGYNNEGWVEKVYYEDDVKIWMEKADSNIRTYYKPDGSVDRTETIP